MKASKKKKVSFNFQFPKIHVDFRKHILILGGIIIFVFLYANTYINHSLNKINLHSPSPTVSVYKIPQPTTFNLMTETTLSSGWKRYTVPSQCYSFALPPNFIPIYSTWGEKGDGQYCDNGDVTVNIDSYTSIIFSIAPGGHGFSSPEYLTEEHILVADNPYTVTSLKMPGKATPLEIRADPSDEKLLYKLPSIGIASLNEQRNGSKEIDSSVSNLFYEILTTISSSKQTQ